MMGDKAFTPATPAQQGAKSPSGIPVSVLVGCAVCLAGFLIVMLALVVALVVPAVFAARNAANLTASSNNLSQIGRAIHSYHDTYKSLPPAGTQDRKVGLGLSCASEFFLSLSSDRCSKNLILIQRGTVRRTWL